MNSSPYSSFGNTVIRYVITHIGKIGLRTLTFGAQARNTFDSYDEAETFLTSCKKNGLTNILTAKQIETLKVIPCECWANSHDPTRSYFD